MVHAAVAHAAAGDVLVLTLSEPAPVALLGELLVTQAQSRGVVGILVDGAVRVGGVTIAPGDLVIMDCDGVVALPSERVVGVVPLAVERAEHEAALRERYAAGELSYDLNGLREVVEGT